MLVVDDDNSIRSILPRILISVGKQLDLEIKVDTATDGLEGIEKYEERFKAGNPYDVVLTDLNMPRASGADVVRRVKELSERTSAYVITGYEATEEYAKLVAELGQLKPDGIIQKPFGIDKIKELIEDTLQKRASQITTSPPKRSPDNAGPTRPTEPSVRVWYGGFLKG